MSNLMAEVVKPTTPEAPKITLPLVTNLPTQPETLQADNQPPGPPTSPHKRVASSMPQSSSPSDTNKQVKDDDGATGSKPKSSPSAQESRTARSYAHIRDLSPNGVAEREEWVRKEMAELDYWHEHPGELLAQIRQTDPTYKMLKMEWSQEEQQWYQDMLEEHMAWQEAHRVSDSDAEE
ncbi:hypothetical protein CNMCM5793_002045 [Aspergillus hiratsukae]|uniref:Uncharacterized protein n=1 Tax=Aspergillus hiratsukae TaxID=1194566 RepID=A0A8H6UGC8_9EURO|nr:hypothetical protein CNMCM5793_002045 [Aspergillus hiratsukae]KAF7170046.1 hypothetical protein CNMCM6106_004891 [Aspergillus hiratsukae]